MTMHPRRIRVDSSPMGVTIALRHVDSASPFRYLGGDWSVDFVGTATWVEGGLDRFASYGRVIEWAEGAGAVSPRIAAALRSMSEEYPARAVRVLADAVRLRDLLERLFFRIYRHNPARDEIADLNDSWLRRSLAELALTRTDDGTFQLGWPRADSELESPLWIVARAAAGLITSSDASRIKRCGGEGCGWYYVDRSRNGMRRWCEMETCGTRMKSLRRAARTAATDAGSAPLESARA